MNPLGVTRVFPDARHRAAEADRGPSRLRLAAARLWAGCIAWRNAAREVAELQALDYRELRDCGLNRLDVQSLSKGSFRAD